MKNGQKALLKKILLLVAAAAIFFYYNHDRQIEQAASQQATRDKQEKQAAEAVTVLPPGTEEAWDAFIDSRVASTLQRSGNTVRLNDSLSKMMQKTTFVSVNSPYTISCDITGSSINFPSTAPQKYSRNEDDATDDAITEYLYTMNVDRPVKSEYINIDPKGVQPPPLGVDIGSVAANNLRAHLCQRITDKVQAIFTLQPPTDGGAK